MQDDSAFNRWVAVARRLMALDAGEGDREVPLPLATGADEPAAPDEDAAPRATGETPRSPAAPSAATQPEARRRSAA